MSWDLFFVPHASFKEGHPDTSGFDTILGCQTRAQHCFQPWAVQQKKYLPKKLRLMYSQRFTYPIIQDTSASTCWLPSNGWVSPCFVRNKCPNFPPPMVSWWWRKRWITTLGKIPMVTLPFLWLSYDGYTNNFNQLIFLSVVNPDHEGTLSSYEKYIYCRCIFFH